MSVFAPKRVRYLGRALVPALPIAGEVAPTCAAAYVAFLLLNVVLFLRPMELIPDPDIYGLELYQYLIIVCMVLGFPSILAQLRLQVLERRPITLCMFGLLGAIALSHLVFFDFATAGLLFVDYLKVVVYFLLFTGLITTPARLRRLLNFILVSVVIVAATTVLQYHEIITLPTIDARGPDEPAVPGQGGEGFRLRATGIFRDPNDLCTLLSAVTVLALYRLTNGRFGARRLLWLAPLGLLAYAIQLTQSRGGLLALLVGISVVLVMRFGTRVGAVLALLLIPAVLLILAGSRQAALSTETDTGRSRVEVWTTGLMLIRESPVFGIGAGEYAKRAFLVAHNSYLQAYSETGLLGGTFFLGACFLMARHFYRLRRGGPTVRDPEMRRLVPFLAGACAAYCAGMMSLSLTYLVTTAMILAIGEVMPRLARTDPEIPEDRANPQLLGRLFVVGIAFLAAIWLFAKVILASSVTR
jgi:O-antigen ligase